MYRHNTEYSRDGHGTLKLETETLNFQDRDETETLALPARRRRWYVKTRPKRDITSGDVTRR